MKTSFFSIVLIISCLFISSIAQGQVQYRKSSDAINISKKVTEPKEYKMKRIDVQALIEEDDERERNGKPHRFGTAIDVNLSTNNSGDWEEVDGGRVWSLSIYSQDAFSINLKFEKLFLPEGAELIIYNNSRDMIYGPVTSKQNSKNGHFLTDLIKGDRIILELLEPNSTYGKSKLKISKVIHGYKNMFYQSFGGSGGCQTDVECPLGQGWETESDAVAMVLMADGTEWCTGSLVNTNCQDFIPYFLTAFHCIDVSANGSISAQEIADAEDWMFRFQYKSPTCGGGDDYSSTTYNGSTFRSAWSGSDFALVEMDQLPTSGSMLGWDRSTNIPTSTTIIHHPNGDVMKISENTDPPTIDQNNFFFIDDWESGNTTQSGSSGAAYFDQNQRVIGQHTAGELGNDCDAQRGSYFGRLSSSWNGGGTNDTRLSNWLSTNPNITQTNTVIIPEITGTSVVCTSNTTFTLANPPEGQTISWSVSPSNLFAVDSGTDSLFTTYAASSSVSGQGTITATLTGCGQPATFSKTVWVGKPAAPIMNGPYPKTFGCYDMSVSLSTPGYYDNTYDWSASQGIGVYPEYVSCKHNLPNPGVTGPSASFKFLIGTSGYIYTQANNGCPETTSTATYVVKSGGGPLPLTISPNPTSVGLNFDFPDEPEEDLSLRSEEESSMMLAAESVQEQEPTLYQLIMYNDQQQQVLKDEIIEGQDSEIDISYLEKGTYFLHIIYEGEVEIKQIIKE